MKKIAIQGVKGCFHHTAVSDYFGASEEYELFECATFKALAGGVAKLEVDAGVMAIENSIAGTILPNYALLSKHNLKIIGEIYIPIRHQLMALPGQTLQDIREVISHPMAILQCEEFLDHYPNIKISEYPDTAGAAQHIADKQLKGLAAIAPKNASEVYGMEILATDIHTISNNFTRFFIIKASGQEIFKKDFDKASLNFKLPHTTTSLFEVFRIIAELGINITKIQSMPIIEKPWEYRFFVDLSFDDTDVYKEMKRRIGEKTQELSIMGEYKNGKNQ